MEPNNWFDYGLKYLEYGAIGLGALTFILCAVLLYFEQKKETPRENILKSIKQFLIVSVILFTIGLISEFVINRFNNISKNEINIVPENNWLAINTNSGLPIGVKIYMNDSLQKEITYNKDILNIRKNHRYYLKEEKNKKLYYVVNSVGTKNDTIGYINSQDLTGVSGNIRISGSIEIFTLYPYFSEKRDTLDNSHNFSSSDNIERMDNYPFTIYVNKTSYFIKDKSGKYVKEKNTNKELKPTEVRKKNNHIFKVNDRIFMVIILQANNLIENDSYTQFLIAELD
ncbi:MAG: hypothetical protein KAT68_12405 [Bacteroidales bacterium]|nr:hypothetical protein [Bacteroidales bacterium]